MDGIPANLVRACALLAIIVTGCSQPEGDSNDYHQRLLENTRAGKAFLKENAHRDGVVTRPSGLQYRIIRAGNGNKPGYADEVTVHYRGTHLDGTEFDSSYSRGKPAAFRLDRVIPGWTEALQLMRKEAKWQLFIPPELAYGSRGAKPAIGPNEVLIFEVELLKINQTPAQ